MTYNYKPFTDDGKFVPFFQQAKVNKSPKKEADISYIKRSSITTKSPFAQEGFTQYNDVQIDEELRAEQLRLKRKERDKDLNFFDKWRKNQAAALGTMAENSSLGGIKESQGRISLAKQGIEAAEAYEYMQALQMYAGYMAAMGEKTADGQDYSTLAVPFSDGRLLDSSWSTKHGNMKGIAGLYEWLKEKGGQFDKKGYSTKDLMELSNYYASQQIGADNTKTLAGAYLSDYFNGGAQYEMLKNRNGEDSGIDQPSSSTSTLGLTPVSKTRIEIERLKKKLKDNGQFEPADFEQFQKRQKGVNTYKAAMQQRIDNEEKSLYEDRFGGLLPSKMKRYDFWKNYWGVSDEDREFVNSANSFDWKDLDFWRYGMVGQYGYSASSGAGIAGQAIGYAGTAAGVAIGGAMVGPSGAALGSNIVNLAVAPLNMASGASENYQEIADKWTSNFKENLENELSIGDSSVKDGMFSNDPTEQPKGIDSLDQYYGIKDLQKKAIRKAVKSGVSNKNANKLYDIKTDEGLNNVLSMYLQGTIESNDPILSKAAIGTTKGLQQQFTQDMATTTTPEILQTGVSMISLPGNMGSFASSVLSRAAKTKTGSAIASSINSIGNRVVSHAGNNSNFVARTINGVRAAKNGVNGVINSAKDFASDVSRYRNGAMGQAIQTGESIGSEVSAVLGGGMIGDVVGRGVGGAVGAAAKSIKDAFVDAMPQKAKIMLSEMADNVVGKYNVLGNTFKASKIGKATTKLIEKNPKMAEFAKLLAEHGVEVVHDTMIDHFSEGNEELKQYINSMLDFAKTYGYNPGSISDVYAREFAQGEQVAKFYAASLGIGKSELLNDQEAVSNWKGGFFMGGLHPVAFVHGVNSIYDAGVQANATSSIATWAAANREAENYTRANNATLAKMVTRSGFLSPKYNEIKTALQENWNRDKQRAPEERVASDAMWQERLDALETIKQLDDNRDLRQKLEASGIRRGTSEYNEALSDMAHLYYNIQQNDEYMAQNGSTLRQMYAKEDIVRQSKSILDRINSNEIEGAKHQQEIGDKFVEDYVAQNMAEHEQELSEEEKNKLIDQYTKEANEKREDFVKGQLERERNQWLDNINNISHLVNQAKALIGIRAQMNVANDWFDYTNKLGLRSERPDAKLLQQHIDKQINQVKQQLEDLTKDKSESIRYSAKTDDAHTLEYIDQLAGQYSTSDELVEAEKLSAIYQANNELYQSQLDSLFKDVVRNKDGKYEYNPEEAKYQRGESAKRMANPHNYKQDESHVSAKPEDPTKSYAYRRMRSIIQARQQNADIEAAISEAINDGDAVTHVIEQEIEEQDKESTRLQNIYNEEKQFSNNTSERESKNDAQNRRRGRKEAARAAIIATRQKHKAERKKRRRAHLNGLHADVTLGLGYITYQVADKLLEEAQVATYKFQDFIQDMKDVMGDSDVNTLEYRNLYINYAQRHGDPKTMDSVIDVYNGDQVVDAKPINGTPVPIRFSSFSSAILEDGTVYIDPRFINRPKTPRWNQIKDAIVKNPQSVIDYLKTEQAKELYGLNDSDISFIEKSILSDTKGNDTINAIADYLEEVQQKQNPPAWLPKAIGVHDSVYEILLHAERLNTEKFLSKEAIANVENIVKRLANAGYKILDVQHTFYTKNLKGDNVKISADVILKAPDGHIAIIDVYTSSDPHYQELMRYNDYSRKRDVRNILENIREALLVEHNGLVTEMYVMPFNTREEKAMPLPIMAIKSDQLNVHLRQNADDKISKAQLSKALAQQCNSLIEQYNTLANQLKEAGLSQQDVKDIVLPQQTITPVETLLDIDAYNNMKDQLESYISQMQIKLNEYYDAQRQEDSYKEQQNLFDIQNLVESVPDQEIQDLHNVLTDTCERLDNILDTVTNLTASTPQERQKITSLMSAVYSAQNAIDALYTANQGMDGINVTQEQDLINNAINKLIENGDLYGINKEQIKQWFEAQFSSMYGNPFAIYVNKLGTFMSTFRSQFLDNLVGKPTLIAFWGGIFKNIVPYHIRNAEALLAQYPNYDQTTRQILTDVVSRAKAFLTYFNSRFTIDETATDTIDPNDADSINGINIDWHNFYTDNDMHYPALDAPARANFGFYTKVMNDPNLITNGHVELLKDGSGISLKVTNSKGNSVTLSFTQVNPLPRNLDPRFAQRKIDADKAFTKKVLLMFDFISKHPDYHIEIGKVFRNKGRVVNDANDHNVTEFIMAGTNNQQDLYSITFGNDYSIGVVKDIVNLNTGDINKVVSGGQGLASIMCKFDTVYDKRNAATLSGNLVYFYNTGYAEDVQNDGSVNITKRVPIPLRNKKFTKQQAYNIVDMISAYANGNSEYQGYDILSMLNHVLYIPQSGKVVSSFNSLESALHITKGNKWVAIGGDQNGVNANWYDMSTSQGKNALYAKLQTMYIANNEEFLNYTITQRINNGDAALLKARSIIQQSGKNDVTLPNGLTFTKEDFTHNGVGTTLLGHFLRNGIIFTGATRIDAPNIFIGDVKLVKTQKLPTSQQAAQQVAEQSTPSSLQDRANKIADAGFSLFYEQQKETVNHKNSSPSFKDAVDEWLESTVGMAAIWHNAQTLSDMPNYDNCVVLGKCSTEAIELSNSVPKTIGFHEGFHRCFELMVEPEVRDKMYSNYRKKHPDLSDREIAEALADLFVDYMAGEKVQKDLAVFDKAWRRTLQKMWSRIKLFRAFGLNGFGAIRLFNAISNGKYKNNKISEEVKRRYETTFGESLHYEINGQNFTQIANSIDKEDMAKSIAYYIITSGKPTSKIYNILHSENQDPYTLLGQNVINNLVGLHNTTVSPEQAAFRELFEFTSAKDFVMSQYNKHAKFNAFMPEVRKYVDSIIDLSLECENAEEDINTEDEFDTELKHTEDRYDRASFEFSKMDSVAKPVKFLFSTVPYMEFDNTKQNLLLDTSKNKFGTPQFMPINEVYNIVAKRIGDVKSVEDMINRLKSISDERPIYLYLYNKLNDIYKDVYQYDNDGKVVKIDYDKEGFLTQVFGALKCHMHTFIFGKATRTGDSMEVVISNSAYDKDAVALPRAWCNNLSSGQTGVTTNVNYGADYIQLADKINMNGKDVSLNTTSDRNMFVYAATFINQLRDGLLNANASSANIGGRIQDISSVDGIREVKKRMLGWFNILGIQMNTYALDHMLVTKYGNYGRQGLTQLLTESGNSSIQSFLNKLQTMVLPERPGFIRKQSVDELFRTGFVVELAQWVSAYNKLTTDSKVIGMDNKSLYNLSQNNSITDTVNHINTNDKNDPVVDLILNYSYNIINANGFNIGSIVAKQLAAGQGPKISVATPIGFRTNNANDTGAKYSENVGVEDYINKLTMLQYGYCVMPTLADKGTYHVLSGITIPGMTFTANVNNIGEKVVNNAPKLIFRFDEGWSKNLPRDDSFYLQPTLAQVSQMIEYAKTERQSILDCRQQLGLHVDNPNPEITPIDKSAYIANYHYGKNGARGIQFTSLTSLSIPQKDGSIKRYDLTKLSADEQLKTADELFFNKPYEDQIKIMTLTLQEQVKEEVKKAESLGIIRFKEDDQSMLTGLENVNLNKSQIEALAKEFTAQIKSANIPGLTTTYISNIANSMAVAAILQDATIRHIISTEEIQRLFIGNPAFFKNAKDLQKRIGGLVSTGEDNNTAIKNLDETSSVNYTCAEMKSYIIGSTSHCMKTLENDMIEGELKTVYGDRFGYADVNNPSFNVREEFIEKYKSRGISESEAKAQIRKIEDKARAFYNSYTDDINVADGASYITADFCKALMRARGEWNNATEKAFQILEEGGSSWQDRRDAFDLVYKNLQVVTTKYTAYGFRPHMVNGRNVPGGLVVPYYNKFALFPLFDSMATGHMKDVYDKMKNEHVDNLLTVDAVKLGQQGAIKYDEKDGFTEPFVTYTQRLSALRRQLNTDPEEGDHIAIGTQMIKIVLSNLRLDKQYGDMSGEEIRDKFMQNIKQLSEIGKERFMDKFYTNGMVDEKKISQYLIDQLGSRAANKNLLEALQYNNTTKQMNAPIAATVDASWMESMLISAINKDIVNIVAPGTSYVQRSAFAMEGSKTEGGRIQGTQLYNGKKLQMINDQGSMDAVISINYFSNILPKDLSFNEAKQWLIDNNIIGDNAKADTVAYRIPTQAQASIHALRFVDVLPVAMDTIILPEEFTKITGSDKYQCLNQYNIKNRVNCLKLHIKWTTSSQALD